MYVGTIISYVIFSVDQVSAKPGPLYLSEWLSSLCCWCICATLFHYCLQFIMYKMYFRSEILIKSWLKELPCIQLPQTCMQKHRFSVL